MSQVDRLLELVDGASARRMFGGAPRDQGREGALDS
jgi:hypothetical protein